MTLTILVYIKNSKTSKKKFRYTKIKLNEIARKETNLFILFYKCYKLMNNVHIYTKRQFFTTPIIYDVPCAILSVGLQTSF